MPEATPNSTRAATLCASGPSERTSVLRLSRELGRPLDEHALEGYPNEACGLLIGRTSIGHISVERVETADNLATDRLRDRYILDPNDFLAADQAARRAGLDIVGIWHTHPDHPARPSQADIERAWEGYTYLILSVGAEGVADRRAWRLIGSRFAEQPIEEGPS